MKCASCINLNTLSTPVPSIHVADVPRENPSVYRVDNKRSNQGLCPVREVSTQYIPELGISPLEAGLSAPQYDTQGYSDVCIRYECGDSLYGGGDLRGYREE